MDSMRYVVVRYPDGYAVADKQDRNKIVFSTKTRTKAWAERNRLEKEAK